MFHQTKIKADSMTEASDVVYAFGDEHVDATNVVITITRKGQMCDDVMIDISYDEEPVEEMPDTDE